MLPCLLYLIIHSFGEAFAHSLDSRSGSCWHSWNSRGSSSQSTCAHVSWPNMECYAAMHSRFLIRSLSLHLSGGFEEPVQVHHFHVLNPWSSDCHFSYFFSLYFCTFFIFFHCFASCYRQCFLFRFALRIPQPDVRLHEAAYSLQHAWHADSEMGLSPYEPENCSVF